MVFKGYDGWQLCGESAQANMAAITKSAEEDLRYYSCIGHEEGVRELISLNVDLNSRNSMNGWTALHWAASRSHSKIVEILLQNGANPGIRNDKGETPANLTQNVLIHRLLGENSEVETRIPQLPITPSYLKYPPLPISKFSEKHDEIKRRNQQNINDNSKHKRTPNELVLKVRLADAEDSDFIEIELDKDELTIDKLTDVCCDEFELNRNDIMKIRKLPNTVIRKDRDVGRLEDYQEIEIVLCSEH